MNRIENVRPLGRKPDTYQNTLADELFSCPVQCREAVQAIAREASK